MSHIACDIKKCGLLRRTLYSSMTAILLLLTSCEKEKATASEYERLIDRASEVWHFQGSYLVARGDSILARGSRGYADISAQRANQSETRFLIGSMTKPFTAIAVLQLVERGLVDLSETIDSYIDDYPAEKAKGISVHYLLCHRSGIPDVVQNREYAGRMSDSIGPHEIVEYFADKPLEFEPGSRYAYSSSNYVLLGLIIESRSGLTWEEYIKQHICMPAGMMNTGVFYDYPDRQDFAKGYTLDRSGSLTRTPAVNPSIGYAAGALASNVDDLFLLNLVLYDTTLLDRFSLDMMLTEHSRKYGYGWIVDDFGGHTLTAHGGGVPGYVSILQRWTDDSVCVIVLSNNVAVQPHAIANSLAAIALDEPYEMPQNKVPVAIDSALLLEYEGDYDLGSGEIRRIQVRDGRLMVQTGIGFPRPVLPEGQDRFFFAHDPTTTLTFLRNSEGDVIGLVMSQAFDQDTTWKSNY
jgi:CubicO group peptidase (beta-lactamase class C family)